MAGVLLFTFLAVLVVESSGFLYTGCWFFKGCQQNCVSTLWGHDCTCNQGFILNANMQGCDPIGPCDPNNKCAQTCYNYPFGQRCSCNPGYNVNSNDLNKCDVITSCVSILDIVFLIDSCKEIGTSNYHTLLAFISRLTQHNPVGNTKARYGAYNFGDKVETLFELKDLKTNADVSAKILNATYLGGEGSTNQALDFILQNNVFATQVGGRSNANNILVVFFDGLSSDVDRTLELVRRFTEGGVRVVAVGIGSKVTQEGVKKVASSDIDAFTVPDYVALDNIEQSLSARIC